MSTLVTAACGAVLIPHVADRLREIASLSLDSSKVRCVRRCKPEIKEASCVGKMVAYPQPCAHDHTCHHWAVEDRADGYRGYTHTMAVGDPLGCVQQFLEQVPAAPDIYHLLVLAQTGRIQINGARLRFVKVAFGEQPSADGAVGQQLHTVFAAERLHALGWSAVEERILHLVRDDANAVREDECQALCIEVGQSQVANFARFSQLHEIAERIQVACIGIVPPMELEQVKLFNAHASQRGVDCLCNVLPCDTPPLGHP